MNRSCQSLDCYWICPGKDIVLEAASLAAMWNSPSWRRRSKKYCKNSNRSIPAIQHPSHGHICKNPHDDSPFPGLQFSRRRLDSEWSCIETIPWWVPDYWLGFCVYVFVVVCFCQGDWFTFPFTRAAMLAPSTVVVNGLLHFTLSSCHMERVMQFYMLYINWIRGLLWAKNAQIFLIWRSGWVRYGSSRPRSSPQRLIAWVLTINEKHN